MNDAIVRNPSAAADVAYDLIIIGGGIYGACAALEAATRGLRPLLLERDDFGGATSANSLRILHGGLRYLQQLDLQRLHESCRERAWFTREFPDLVRPLPCLLPLYATGIRRPGMMRAVLKVNDYLSRDRNHGVRMDRQLPPSRVVDAAEAMRIFPAVDERGLQGGACWYDVMMIAPHRLIVETVRWACHGGARALNYVQALRPTIAHGRVVSIEAFDRLAQTHLQFRAPIVVNCAGPWCREVAGNLVADVPALFRPSLAFNVLLARRPLSESALAVTPKLPRARTYFLVPFGDRMLAGTYHMAWSGPVGIRPRPGAFQIESFLGELNSAVPQLRLGPEEVVEVLPGWLPAVREGDSRQARRAVLLDHRHRGGPAGLFSVSGVKFTTARAVAEAVLRRAIGEPLPPRRVRATRPTQQRDAHLAALAELSDCPRRFPVDVARLVDEESVICVEDLVRRRLGLLDPAAAQLLTSASDPLPSRVRAVCLPEKPGGLPGTCPSTRASFSEP